MKVIAMELDISKKQSLAHKRNRLYLAYEKSLSYLIPQKRLRILFSGMPTWSEDIKRGFNRSRHILEFGPLSARAFSAFDLVMPLEIPDLIAAQQWPHLIAKNPIPIPSEQCILLCNDKYEFNHALIKRGFGSYIPSMEPDVQHPYILKKRIGAWGQECQIIHKAEDEMHILDKLNAPAFYRQKIIRGKYEFATHILFANDRIVKALNIMYEFGTETPIKGQDPVLYRVIHRCTYLDLFARILRAIGFQGLCCVNYKVACGRPYIFEINPRFGGSLSPYFVSFVRHLNCG
jgi:ATP-grasp domain